MTKNVDALLTVKEAAAYFRISVAGVWRLRQEKRLPCVKIGGRTLFRKADMDAFIEKCVQR